MNVLVTGGVGTVGAGLVKELRGRGHHVVSCDLYHQSDEVGFSLRTDVERPLYARCDVGEFRRIERVYITRARRFGLRADRRDGRRACGIHGLGQGGVGLVEIILVESARKTLYRPASFISRQPRMLTTDE
jgi:NAD(P)-dependent dehydrogenase (short-subunit alcohol dehydrogenase family)